MNVGLLHKYLRNACSSEELDEVLQWFRTEAGTPAGKLLLQQSWEQYATQEEKVDVDLEGMLDRLHHQINLTEEKTESPATPPLRARIYRLMSRAAALLFLPVLALLLLTYLKGELLFSSAPEQEWIAISTPPGAKTTFNLPDGSIVWLNHGSSLRYPARFEGKVRELELEGEAYFDVVSDPDHPFRVQTDELEVVALGTEFNVLAYPEDTTLEITLVSGKVDILAANSESDRPLYEMRPDEHLTFQKEARKLVSATVTSDKYIGWKAGKLIFENDDLEQVATRLSRWFNADFELEDTALANYTFTATFVSETLPQVLELLELASPIAYDITPRTLQADGSYSKMKVIISRK